MAAGKPFTRGKSILGKGALSFVADTTATVNPGNLVPDAGEIISVAVTNAALGDIVLVGPGVSMQGITFSAAVTAAGTVAIALDNATAGTINLASSTWKIKVLR